MNLTRKDPTIGLLGATFATNNLGVSALAAGTVRCALEQHPDAEVFLLDYGREPQVFTLRLRERVVELPLVNLRFSWRIYLRNNIARLLLAALALKVFPSRRFRERLLSKNEWLRRICSADLIAAISGGDSFSDIYGFERLLYVALPQILALLLGKRLVLLPQTIGPFRGRIAKSIARYILTRAELVYSRDRTGLTETASLMGEPLGGSKLRFFYDVGFAVEPIAPATLEIAGLEPLSSGAGDLVGFNVSGLLFMGGYTRDNMFGLKVDYVGLVRELIAYLIREKNARVLLVPHVLGEHSESDASVCERLYDTLKEEFPGRIGYVRGWYNQSEIKHVIGQCDFFIGSRMHACIAAVSQNIPAVAIAYSDKFVGVMQSIGIESLVVDARGHDASEVRAAIERAFEQRDSLRRQLEQTMPQVKAAVLKLFRDIAENSQGAQAVFAGSQFSSGPTRRSS
jgi:polysaccharide pyruvyl transferase WcaK-like protein